MKKILILASLSGMLLAACKSSQLAYNADDAYANPVEEKKLAELARAEAAKKEAAERQKREEEIAAQKAKDDANPYYKDPDYNADDYYDYEYAARLNRFYNPIGVGYYDGYYTNLYTYNQNPAFYGTSIYSNYGYGMPSTTFNNWSFGISSGWGFNNGFYGSAMPVAYGGWNSWGWYNDPWFYNDPYRCSFYNGWGWGNSPYMNGYMNGYSQGFSQGWQANYFNMYDPYSGYQQMVNAPRNSPLSSNSGHNRLTMNADGNNARREYVEMVQQQQVNSPRFSEAYESSARRGGAGSTFNQGGGSAPQQQIYRNRVEQNRAESMGQNTGNGRVRNPNAARQYEQQQNNAGSNRQSRSSWENNSGNTGGGGGVSSPRNSGGGGDSGARRRSR